MLNSKQQEAVNHTEGPLLVLAGAGSGKTKVVTTRIAHLIELGTPASDILAVTFTNKAAEEMRKRVQNLTASRVMCLTFHSLGARILREKISSLGYGQDFTIYDEEDALKVIKDCLNAQQIKPEKGTLRSYKSAISSFKNALLEPHQVTIDTQEDKIIFNTYQMYQKKLKDYNALDFDDLLFLTVKLLQEDERARQELQNRWQFLLVDEYQDTNTSQYILTKILSAKHNNLFVVGDPDQSIYSWRGAQFQNILNFDKDFPGAKVIYLEQNYRSTNTILKAANAVIDHNQMRYEKKLWSEKGEGEKIHLDAVEDEKEEAQHVIGKILEYHKKDDLSFDKMVIFYRTNAQSRTFEDALLSNNIPYVVIGGLSFYQRREIKDLLAFLRTIYSNNDLVAFHRTINLPRRGIGLKTIEKILQGAKIEQKPIISFCIETLSMQKSPYFTPRQKGTLQEYINIILSLRTEASALSIAELIEKTLERTRYLDHLKDDPESFEDRKENLDQLIAKAKEFEGHTLEEFLEEISLKSTADQTINEPCVNLMTLHHGKGLEFPLVFITGLEEDLFPHVRSKYDREALEEERRLFYVGMTRAKSHLFISCAQSRYLFGAYKWMTPSRFLKEIPEQYVEKTDIGSDSLSYSEILEDLSSDKEFLPGDSVVHKDFGVGTVQKGFETSMGKTYDVFFEGDKTTKTLVAKYAKLKPYKASDFTLS